MKTAITKASVVALLACALAVISCDSSCEDAGRTFEDGQEWTCADGCNSCVCTDGTVTTTAIACAGPPGEAAGKLVCHEGGKAHMHGDTWDCDGGCCSCDDGQVSKQPDPC